MTKQEEIREGIQRLWCQHCKATQKTNNTVVECWYNPLDEEKRLAFCASNEDAVDAILKDESDRGVVIKVDRELPECFYDSLIFPTTIEGAGKFLTIRGLTDREKSAVSETIARLGWENCVKELIEAGYVAVEPLVDKLVGSKR